MPSKNKCSDKDSSANELLLQVKKEGKNCRDGLFDKASGLIFKGIADSFIFIGTLKDKILLQWHKKLALCYWTADKSLIFHFLLLIACHRLFRNFLRVPLEALAA